MKLKGKNGQEVKCSEKTLEKSGLEPTHFVNSAKSSSIKKKMVRFTGEFEAKVRINFRPFFVSVALQ